jgi:hypothetical protein
VAFADEDYSPAGYLRYLGAVLAEVSEVKVDFETNDKDVDTLVKELAGHSNGPLKWKVSFKSAIPKTGLEADFVDVAIEHRTIELVFRLGTLELTLRGRILSGSLETSVGNVNMSDAVFGGKLVSKVRVGTA